MSKIIGIDLGTSNSAAAAIENGKAIIIPSAEGNSLGGKAFPSYVAFTKDGQLLIGEPARRQAVTNPEGTVFEAKRKMGTNFRYKINDKEYSPEQISAFILQKIKRDAESHLGDKVEKAVITVPAYFDDAQRQATKQAGEIAGLEVVRVINEPTAAAFAYGIDKTGSQDQKILVFDLGGGTLDVTIMEFSEIEEDGKTQATFEVKSTSGDTSLGGKDMDTALIDYITGEFKNQSGIDVTSDKMAMNRVREAAEKAKIELSSSMEAEINLPFVTVKDGQPQHLVMKLTRAKLESLVGELVSKTFEPVKAALKDAKVDVKDINEVVMVGGMTRMPKITEEVQAFFGKDPNKSVNPDEVVAIGAAIQAGVLTGETKDVVLLDVTPLTLAIETAGSIATPMIERNTTVPTSKSQVFSTYSDNQTQVEIHVLQGERPMARDNKSLGTFTLDGIPPAPRGMPQIEVGFDLDANGILTVKAKDKSSGKEQSIKITGSTGLTKEEVEKMKEEAEKNAEADKAEKEKIEIKNQAEHMIYTSEKALKDAGDKVPVDIKTEVEEKIKDLKDSLENGTKDEVDSKLKALSESLQKMGPAMSSQQSQQAQSEEPTAAEAPEDKTDKADGDKKKDAEEGEVVS